LEGQAVADDLLRQTVLEPEAAVCIGFEERRCCQFIEGVFKFVVALKSRDCFQSAGSERLVKHGGGAQCRLCDRCEAVGSADDELPYLIRRRDACGICTEAGAAVPDVDQFLRNQRLHQRFDINRAATRLLPEQGSQRFAQAIGSQQPDGHQAGVCFGQVINLRRFRPNVYVIRFVHENDQQSHRRGFGQQAAEYLQCALMLALQVVDHDQGRVLSGEGREKLRDGFAGADSLAGLLPQVRTGLDARLRIVMQVLPCQRENAARRCAGSACL